MRPARRAAHPLPAVKLPLAGCCAAQLEAVLSSTLCERLQRALIERSGDPAADLRARVAAARALGDLGDPRFERCRGAQGEYLLPPLVKIAAGRYTIGSDEGIYVNEARVHAVDLAALR